MVWKQVFIGSVCGANGDGDDDGLKMTKMMLVMIMVLMVSTYQGPAQC